MLCDHPVPAWRQLGRTSNHWYLAPHAALRPWVAHYTLTFPSTGSPAQGLASLPPLTILPDVSGCFVLSPNGWFADRIWGATTQAVTLVRDFEQTPERLFVEFRPGGAHRITRLPMHLLTDRAWPLADVLPALHRELRTLLEQQLPLASLLAKLDALLLSRLPLGDDGLCGALLPLPGLGGAGTVASLADATGYSQRHLNRLFRDELGVSVKGCARVLRVNRALNLLRPGIPLSALAQETGYYDQSHFNHDFKRVCGVSPTAYLQSMTDFYKEELKFQDILGA